MAAKLLNWVCRFQMQVIVPNLGSLVSPNTCTHTVTQEGHYYSCVFGKRNYRVLVRVCVCVVLCLCVCFCTITQKEIDLGTQN